MVVSKNKTMKLGAALITAGLGATGIACDGDNLVPPACGFTMEDLISAEDIDDMPPEFIWVCEGYNATEEYDFTLMFFLSGDGEGYSNWDGSPYDLAWSTGGDCALEVVWSSEGDDYPYDITEIVYGEDSLSFTMESDTDLIELECEKQDPA